MEAVLSKLRGKAEKEFQTESSLYVFKETSVGPLADIANETGTLMLTVEESGTNVHSATSDHAGQADVTDPSPSLALEVASEEHGTAAAVETDAVLRPADEPVDEENTKTAVEATDKTLSVVRKILPLSLPHNSFSFLLNRIELFRSLETVGSRCRY